MSWSSWKKKEGIFYYLFCPIFNIYVFISMHSVYILLLIKKRYLIHFIARP